MLLLRHPTLLRKGSTVVLVLQYAQQYVAEVAFS
jgi:hypothetical protein